MCDIQNIEDYKVYNDLSVENYKILQNEFENTDIKNYGDFVKYFQRKYKINIRKSDLLKVYNNLNYTNLELKKILTKKINKSTDGIISLTIVTPASYEYDNKIINFSCEYDCFYCPNQPGQPRSYIDSSPALLRSNMFNFDTKKQIYSRLNTLIEIGHEIDKLEVIILGGTFQSYKKEFHKIFISDVYYYINIFYDIIKRNKKTLEEEIKDNEFSKIKIIGLTIETRPDLITIEEIKWLRYLSITRVQLGIQVLNDYILKKVNRKCTCEDCYNAIKLLKDNCFKIDIHIMQNLPFSTPDIDTETLNKVLYDERMQIDYIKLYPCAVLPYTKIKQWYENKTYIPYDEEYLYDIIKNFKLKVPKYIRINRILREWKIDDLIGGYSKSSINLRNRLQNDKVKCNCIRCRTCKNNNIDINDIKLDIEKYKSSLGIEYFISYNIISSDLLIGFLRLRINNKNDKDIIDELKNTSLIRELHVYGKLSVVGDKNELSLQHNGYGKKLLEKAKEITLDNNLYRMSVIVSGGARGYYKKYGFIYKNYYMIKTISYYEIFKYYIVKFLNYFKWKFLY